MKIKKIFTLILAIGVLIFISFYINKLIKEYYSQYDLKLVELRKKMKNLHPAVSDIEMYIDDNETYTINKQKIYMCLKDENNEYYDMNMLSYAFIHELAHVITFEEGHTELFFKNFDKLLSRAIELGIYDPTIPIVKKYCGIVNH